MPDRETFRKQAFAQMEEGLHLGGPPIRGGRSFMIVSTAKKLFQK